MPKNTHDIIVVGAGHNGLTAASYMAKAGLDVLVLEKNEWIGFCSYRELWANKKNVKDKTSIKSLIQNLPDEWSSYDAIIGEPFFLERPKLIRINES